MKRSFAQLYERRAEGIARERELMRKEQTPQASTPETGCFVAGGASSNRGVIYQRGFVLPSPTMIMAAVIIGLSISNLLFFNLYRSTANEHAQFKADVSAAQEAVRLDNERKLQEVTAVHRQVEHDYAKARAALAAGSRVVRVRESCSGTGILPGVPTAALKPDAAAVEPTLSASVSITAEECEQVANDAVMDAAKLAWLQAWVISTHEASK